MSNITKDELIRILDKYLFGWCYKDIERASIYGDAKMAGFILGCCFIDTMAGFYAGIDKEESKRNSRKRFEDFVEKYLPKYDREKLWEDLRCGLVHSYTVGQTHVFTDAYKAGFHFDTTKRGKIILNLEDFCADLRKAYKNFRNDILTKNEIFLNAKRRYEFLGLMHLIPKEDL